MDDGMRDIYRISREELGKGSLIPIVKLGQAGEVFYEMALDMVRAIEANNAEGRTTAFICPVGPVGQYPIFVRIVNERRISLRRTWFFNMDEYLDEGKAWLDEGHRLSFRGFMDRNVYSRIDPGLVMPESQRIFPDPARPGAAGELMASLGGIDVCYGGIGITGHVAFNEPEDLDAEEYRAKPARVLPISPETRAVNAIGDLGGAVEAMPRWCVTLGMREILAARRVRLYCFRDWHRAVVRRAAYGEKGGRFPASLLQDHPDARITVTENAAEAAY